MSLQQIDTFILFFINRELQGSILDFLMPIITDKYYFLILGLMIWIAIKDKKGAVVPIVLTIISIALSDWASHMLKHLIERPRPCHALEEVRLLVGCSRSFSMPSNHAANAFAIIFPLSYASKKWIKWPALIIAVLVGLSRIYVGVHYPSDVMVGALIGIIVSLLVISLYKWTSLRYKIKPYSTILFVSLLGLSLFRIYYISQGVLDLSPDEAHYWEWSRRLDLSYYSKGPMIAYLIAFGTAVFGDNIFGIRITAVIFSALSSIALYILGKKLFDERVGTLAALLIQIVPLYSAYGIFFTIDSPFIFFWILSLFLFWEAVDRTKTSSPSPIPPPRGGRVRERVKFRILGSEFWLWLLLGLSIGIGLLTKYTMAFFYLCSFLFLIVSKQYRNILLTRWPYISLIVSLIVFSPVIIWNAGHDFVTLKHTAGQAHISDQWSLISSQWSKNFFEFLGSQIGIITPVIFVLMIYALFKLTSTYPPLTKRGQKDGTGGLLNGNFLFWFSIPVILFFLLKSLHGKVQANWALPGYATGFIAFAALFIGRWESMKKWLRWVIVAGIILSLSVTAIGHYTEILRLPPKTDPSARLKGWKQLGEEVNRLSDELSKKGDFFIFSDKYQISSELAFYVKEHPVTYCINLGRRMNQYDLWPGFNNLIHFNAIFVTINNLQIPEELKEGFSKCEQKIFTAYDKKDVKLRDYAIFTCYDFKGIKQKGAISY